MSWSSKTILDVVEAVNSLNLKAELLAESREDYVFARRTVRVYVKSFDVHVCEHQDGMTVDEIKRKILNPIIEHLKKEKGKIKMTREEAIKAYMMATGKLEGESSVDIQGLEALGLIKFDEPKIELSPSSIIKERLDGIFTKPMHEADQIVNSLMRNGYKIVKADNA